MKAKGILFICILVFLFANSKLVLSPHTDLSKIQFESFLSDPFIEVQANSYHFNKEEYEMVHLKFVEIGRNKRHTYERFTKKYKNVVTCLVNNKIVPHDFSMVHTGVQVNFISKKRVWEFSRVFVLYSHSSQLKRMLLLLEPYNLIALKQRSVTGYLNEKLLAMKAFTAAKDRLQRMLRGQRDIKLQILSVVNINIQGKGAINSYEIESQLKEEQNFSKSEPQRESQLMQQGKNKQKRNQFYDKEEDITMKVLFKIGEKVNDKVVHEDDEEDSKKSESQGEDEIEDLEQVSNEEEGEEL